MMERHIITGEFPPDVGGVAAYTALLASALASAGERVHVWCGGDAGETIEGAVTVHRVAGRFARADLRRLDAAISRRPEPRRVLVQWVPHAFGARSMNVPFCLWVLRRGREAGDAVEVMVHEPSLPFGGIRQSVAAAVHRLMAAILMQAASRVWVGTPAWAEYWAHYRMGRPVRFAWLPIPATVPPDANRREAAVALRASLLPAGGEVIGSFASGDTYWLETISASMIPVLRARPTATLLLMGKHSSAVQEALSRRTGPCRSRIIATGCVPAATLSHYLTACDVIVQPYARGVCTRHSTAMNVAAHDVPLVTTAGTFTEPLWHEAAAVSFADPAALGARVEQLLDDPAARGALSRRGRELYDTCFDMRHTVTALTCGQPVLA